MQEENKSLALSFRSTNKWLWSFLVLSLIAHTPLLWMKLELGQYIADFDSTTPNEKVIKLVLQSKKSFKDKQQVVNNENLGEKVEPEKSRFLGERNQKVERETTQREIGTFKVAGQGVKSGVETPSSAEAASALPAAARKKMTKTSKKALQRAAKKISFSDLAMEVAPTPETLERRAAKINRNAKGLKKGKAGEIGLGRNNDYIEDVPLGDMTALNTVEFKYFGFYHRIRLQLEQHWGKSLKEQVENLYRTGRRIASGNDKITALRITIDHKGQILDVQVKGSSGISELDRAAIEAFNRAGPFPNPPTGMLSNGLAEIEWGFVVKS